MNFLRPPKTWPYAANSTGRHRGSLNLGLSVGRVQVYEAVGSARAIYMDKLGPEVVAYLNDNAATIQESGSFVDLSLFMVGRSLLRTKPMLMFVSNDRTARREAFNLIKRSAIMVSYPDFGLGHMELRAEFENFQPLAGWAGGTGHTSTVPGNAMPSYHSSSYIPEDSLEPGVPGIRNYAEPEYTATDWEWHAASYHPPQEPELELPPEHRGLLEYTVPETEVSYLGSPYRDATASYHLPQSVEPELASHRTPAYPAYPLHENEGYDEPMRRFLCSMPDCNKQFGRAADLERHRKMVHNEESLRKMLCDYRRCPRHENAFHRADHFRDHLRDTHFEDLPMRRRTNLSLDTKWWSERNLRSGWWRCGKCFTRVGLKEAGWKCSKCGQFCEAERRSMREKMSRKEEVTSLAYEKEGHFPRDPRFQFAPPHVYTSRAGPLEDRRLFTRADAGAGVLKAATAGGFVSYDGRYMLHTVNHLFEKMDTATAPEESSHLRDQDIPECEVTGLSDFEDDDEDEVVGVTSRGSMTPMSVTSSGYTFLLANAGTSSSVDSPRSSELESEFAASVSQRLLLESRENDDHQSPPPPRPPPEELMCAGEVILCFKALDSAFVELDKKYEEALVSDAIPSIRLENYREYIEEAPRDADLRITTPNSGTIFGTLSGSSSFIRIPGSTVFQEVYTGKLKRPLVTGDCGAWVRDAVTGKVYGHVVAGSPTSGLIMVIPACNTFAEAFKSLSGRTDGTASSASASMSEGTVPSSATDITLVGMSVPAAVSNRSLHPLLCQPLTESALSKHMQEFQMLNPAGMGAWLEGHGNANTKHDYATGQQDDNSASSTIVKLTKPTGEDGTYDAVMSMNVDDDVQRLDIVAAGQVFDEQPRTSHMYDYETNLDLSLD